MATPKTRVLTHANIGDTVHWRDADYDACRPAIVVAVIGGSLDPIQAMVINDPEGDAYGSRMMEHSSGGHRGTWHKISECPFPVTVPVE